MLDVWVLVLVHGVLSTRKQAFAVLRSKLSSNALSLALISQSIRSQLEVISPYDTREMRWFV